MTPFITIMNKKILILLLTFTTLLCFGFSTLNVNALTTEPVHMIISERDQTQYNCVGIFNFSDVTSSDVCEVCLVGDVYVEVWDNTSSAGSNRNKLKIHDSGSSTVYESYSLSSKIIQIQVVEDAGALYLVIYEISFSYQIYQGAAPQLGSVSRVLLTRYYLGNSVYNNWLSNGIDVYFTYIHPTYYPSCLLNYAYIGFNENDPTIINSWVDNQLTNYLNFNKILADGYSYGYDDGYEVGNSDGADAGYDDGYGDGYDSGYSAGTTNGYNIGYPDGYDVGYEIGYDDGQSGENAISPTWNVLTGIFSTIGTIMAIELVPNLPLGLFILVPLFFSALGLILWIWRRN